MSNNAFKNIPFLKNLDMDDPKDKRKALIFFIALAMVILLLFINTDNKKQQSEAVEESRPGHSNIELLEVPEGQDNDILDAQNMMDARTNSRPNNKDLYEGTVESADPLGDIFEGKDRPVDEKPAAATTSEARRRTIHSFFGISDEENDERAHPTGRKEEEEPTKATTTVRRPMSDPAKSRTAETVTSPPAPAVKEDDNTESVNDTVKVAEDTKATSVQVKRSGSISSIDDSWGDVQGLSSLDIDSQYIEQDEDHPYKVAFTRSEKISSGARVTLRLLEDMIVDGVLIPKNSHLSATCTVGERLNITVNSIEINGRIIRLGLSAYDNDGSPGLYCPTTESNAKARNAASTATSALGSAASTVFGAAGVAARTAANIGASAITSGNKVTVNINSGYVFYLLKDIN